MRRLFRIIAIDYILICLATLVGTAFIGPIGYAPFPLPIGPARTPVVVTLWYGTEKETWLKEAVTRYLATAPTLNGRPIQVELKGLGSRDMVERVAQQRWGNDPPPTVISPASSVWVELLKSEWSARNPTVQPIVAAGTDAAQPLVLTPLVLVAWEERAKVLWPNGPQNLWRDLHDALADPQGWVGRGGPGSWGFVKFGHTSPLTSNSGTQTLLLLAYGFYNKTNRLSGDDILNPEFQQWLTEVEQGVTEFGDSTGFFADQLFTRGPGYLSAAVLYENLVVQSRDRAKYPNVALPVVALYPKEGTFWSDHPYAILNAPWVDTEQCAAAATFRGFLLAKPQQELALQLGFRPGDPNIPIGAPIGAAHGVDPCQPQTLLEVPGVDVITAARAVWGQNKKRVDVMAVLDVSGSMTEENRLERAKSALRTFIQQLADEDGLGLTIFSSQPTRLCWGNFPRCGAL